MLPIGEDALARLLRVAPQRGCEDGLGDWVAFSGRLASGVVVELIHYPLAPPPAGFALRADLGSPWAQVLDDVLALVGMGRAELPWISPIVEPGPAPR